MLLLIFKVYLYFIDQWHYDMVVMPVEQLGLRACYAKHSSVKRVLYKRDDLSIQYQSTMNEIYERPSKIFRVCSFHFVCRMEVALVCQRGIFLHTPLIMGLNTYPQLFSSHLDPTCLAEAFRSHMSHALRAMQSSTINPYS